MEATARALRALIDAAFSFRGGLGRSVKIGGSADGKECIDVMNMGALIIGIGFFLIAILDGIGSQIHISKRYRANNKVREWQKKRVFADILIGAGSMIIYFDPKGTKNQFYIGTIVLIIGLFFLCVLDHKFKKS